MTARDCDQEAARMGVRIADEIECWLERTRGGLSEPGEPELDWRQGEALLSAAAAGLRQSWQWGPLEAELEGAAAGCRVAVQVLAAAALHDFQADGDLHHGLMIVHERYSGPLRNVFGAERPLYAGPREAPANPRPPDLARLAIGAPPALAQEAVESAAVRLAAAQRLAAAHLHVDTAAPWPPDRVQAYQQGFAAAIATTEELAAASGAEPGAPGLAACRVELALLREAMASCGEQLAAWAAPCAAGELRTQALAHAENLILGERAVPAVTRQAAPALQDIATFFERRKAALQEGYHSRVAANALISDTLGTHFGGLAAAARGLAADAQVDGGLFLSRLPDIHLLNLLDRITDEGDLVLHSAMAAFVHGQAVAADALAGSAASSAPGDLREALRCAAAQTEFRADQLAGTVRRMLEQRAAPR